MARSFNGTSDYQSISLQLSSYQKLSLSCWCYWDSYANDDDLMFELSPNYGAEPGFIVDPNSASTKFDLYVSNTGGYNGGNFTRPSGGTWHHFLFWFDMTLGTSLETGCYVDGISQTLSQTFASDNSAFYFPDNRALYFMCRNNSTLFGAGDLAEVAMYPGIVLSASQAGSLSSGLSPLGVSPENLLFYFDEVRGLNDRLSSSTLTDSGTTIAAHPPIYYSIPPSYIMASATVATLSVDIGMDEAAYQGTGVRVR